jgi:CRISPR-associated endoribonuclease Cas6
VRIKLEFASDKEIVIRSGYNSLIQGLIYDLVGSIEARSLHEEGFRFEKRHFRLFTFSEILEKGFFNKENHTFTFGKKISFLVSSPVEWILKQIAINSFKEETFRLGKNLLKFDAVSVINGLSENLSKSQNVIVKAITPIEVHSSFTSSSNSKKTYYYSPFEKEFSYLINQNAKKKWSAYFKTQCQYDIEIKPLFRDKTYETIRYFIKDKKMTVVKGWKGNYLVNGEPEFLKFVLDTGLGSRNSQGFGFVEVINNFRYEDERK